MQNNHHRMASEGSGEKGIGEQLHSYVFRLGSLAVVSITGLSIGLFLLALDEFKTRLADARLQTSALVEEFVSGYERDLTVMSDFIRQTPEAGIENILSLSLLRNRNITGLYVIEKDRSISHERYSTRSRLENLESDQAWAATTRRNLTWFNYRKQAAKPVPNLLMAVSIKNSHGEHQRTLLAQIDLYPLWQQINRFRIGRTGMVYLLDSQGVLILHRSVRYISQDTTLETMLGIRPAKLENNDFQIEQDRSLGYSLVTSQRIEGMDWQVVAILPLTDYLSAALSLLLVLVLFISLTLLLARRAEKFTREEIVRPLQQLFSATKIFESGNLQHRIVNNGHKEFRALGHAFNTMGEQLHKNLEAVHKHVKQLKLTSGVFHHAYEGILITAANGRVIDVSPAFTHMTGLNRQQVLGQSLRQLRPLAQGEGFYRGLWREVSNKGVWKGDLYARKRSGEKLCVSLTLSAIYDEEGEVQNYLALFSDISERLAYEENLQHIAHYDALTDLPNRLMITNLLTKHLNAGQALALTYIDLDGFKIVNDSHGHETGDKLLKIVANRLQACLGEKDTIGRLGGDEFVAVIPGLSHSDEQSLIQRLLEAAATPVFIEGHKLRVSASLGLSFYDGKGDIDGDSLLRQADQAMYQAKMAGRNQYHVFDARVHNQLESHQQGLDRIRKAIMADEFLLFYQPKVNMRSGELLGAEALIRWQCPEKGLVPPGEFIPLIENNNLEIDVSRWVIQRALAQLQRWQNQGLETRVSINLGGYSLLETGFIGELTRVLKQYPSLPPGSLEIEILESSALEDINAVSRTIESCRELGVLFALDDFGTGYSSLSYLKSLPVSRLKIDRSFIHDMMDDASNRALVKSIVTMAAAFDLDVIAEGVENEEQGQLLIAMGCEEGQGFGIGKPMPADAFAQWLQEWRPAPGWSENSYLSR